LLKLSDRMLETASREDLVECVRILALNVAHYRSKFGDLPHSESLELLTMETVDDDQARWLADGMETIVGALGTLEQQHPKH
jgi:hypothetical protein